MRALAVGLVIALAACGSGRHPTNTACASAGGPASHTEECGLNGATAVCCDDEAGERCIDEDAHICEP